MEIISLSIVSFVAVFSALFPIINPIGDAPIFLGMVQRCSPEVRNKLARSISINSFFMLLASMLIGPQLLLFFGITLPALKLAGGLVVISVGWSLLNQKTSTDKSASDTSAITDASASGSTFFPLTMPLTVGPGSIATAIALAAGSKHTQSFDLAKEIPTILGGLFGLLALSITIYVAYREASGLQRLLGANGTNVIMRLFAFILLAIGVQIFLGGVEGFAMQVHKDLPAS